MWRETTKHKRNMRIFVEELDDFLPEHVLDFHVHVYDRGCVPQGEQPNAGGQPIDQYDFGDLTADMIDAYPGRETRAVCFGMPNVAYDKALNDAYIESNCDNRRFFGLMLFDPLSDTPETVTNALESRQFVGIKPYLNYVRKEDPNLVEISEMLPDWVMDIVDATGSIVMLHIPRKLRLADPVNRAQVVDLCRNYPRAKIVLAHVGRAYFMRNILGNLDSLAPLPNLYYDMAMLNNWEVLEYLFSHVRADRILYATDTPIALAPGKSIEINDQYTYVTPVPWELSISDDHGKLAFTSFLYEELRAIRKAVERLRLPDDFVRAIFADNGLDLLEDVLHVPLR